MLIVREPEGGKAKGWAALTSGFRQLRTTFTHIRQLKVVMLFLGAYWLYIDGVDTIVLMAVDYGMAIGFDSSGLMLALLITQALQRPDTTHLAWVTCISFPLAMAAVAYLVERRSAARPWLPPVIASAVAALVLLVVVPFYPVRTYLDAVGQTFGRNQFGAPITNGDRTFYFGSPEGAADAQAVVDGLAARARPGGPVISPGPTTATRTSTTCSRTSSRAPGTSRWIRVWPTRRAPGWPRRLRPPTG